MTEVVAMLQSCSVTHRARSVHILRSRRYVHIPLFAPITPHARTNETGILPVMRLSPGINK